MIHDLRALSYLEFRQIVNRVRVTLRSPGRLLVYVIAIAYFCAVAVSRAHRRPQTAMSAFPEPYAAAAMFAYVTLLGVMAYGAASGIVRAFSSPADARFLTGSSISERTVAIWLQLRRCAMSMARMLFTVLLYALLFSRRGSTIGIALATLGGTAIAAGLAVPFLKFRSVAGSATAQGLAGAITVIGVCPTLILLASLLAPSPFAQGIERLGAGTAIDQLLNANAAALAALYAFGVVIVAGAYACGAGLYPDLYAASLRVLAFREKQKRGPGAALVMAHSYERPRNAGASAGYADALRGPWTIVWKEWVAFLRSPSMQRTFYLGAAVCVAIGAIFGTIAAASRHPLMESVTFAAVATNMIVVFAAMSSAIGLEGDLRKPLWWIGPDPLWTRLLAWVVGTSWRLAACICASIVGWSVAARSPLIAACGIPLGIAAVLYLRAVGLALYALFPSTIDQRGPLAMMRALLTYIMAAPPAIAGIVTLVFVRQPLAATAAAVAVSLSETLLLVAFAAMRIAGSGVTFAQAEAM